MARKATAEDTALAQAAADAALLAAVQERDSNPATAVTPQNTAPEPPARITLVDQFRTVITEMASLKRTTRISEATLVKVWELGLMWELNNRQQPQPSFPTYDVGGDGVDLPEVDEVLGGDATPEDEA